MNFEADGINKNHWAQIQTCRSELKNVLPSGSCSISTAQPPISFIVSLVLSATNSTLESQAVN